MYKNIKSWRDLKQALNELPEEVLDKPVVIWLEEEAKTIESVHILEEDYLFDGDEGCVPASELAELLMDEHPLIELPNEEYYVVHEKGTPILHAD